MSEHPTCEDPDCAICKKRERLLARKLDRGFRPAGRLRLVVARIKEIARNARARGQA